MEPTGTYTGTDTTNPKERKQKVIAAISDKWDPRYTTFGEWLTEVLDSEHGNTSAALIDMVGDEDLVTRINSYRETVPA